MAKKNQPKQPTFIEKLNTDYTKENTTLSKLTAPGGLKDKIEQMEDDIHKYKKDYAVKKMDLDYATSKNDKATQQQLEKDLEAIKKSVAALQLKLQKSQALLDEQQKKVDGKIEQLSKDPETKKKLDSILYKKYDRNRKKLLNQKENLETIKNILNTDNKAKSYYDNFTKSSQREKELNYKTTLYQKQLNDLSAKPQPLNAQDQKKFNEIQQKLTNSNSELIKIKKSISNNKNAFIGHVEKHYKDKNLERATIEQILSSGSISKQIQGLDKSINNYTKLMSGLTVSQELKDFTSKNDPNVSNPAQTTQASASPNLPSVSKPAFWKHPVEWFKYKWNERNAKPSTTRTSSTTTPTVTSKNKDKMNMRDSLRLSKDEYNSEIVNAYLKKREEELHKAAKSTRGNGGNSR